MYLDLFTNRTFRQLVDLSTFIGDAYVYRLRTLPTRPHPACTHRACARPLLLETMMHRVDKPTEMTQYELVAYMRELVSQLRWKHALTDCQIEGRPYTEIGFWRNPETDELVLTYWDME